MVRRSAFWEAAPEMTRPREFEDVAMTFRRPPSEYEGAPPMMVVALRSIERTVVVARWMPKMPLEPAEMFKRKLGSLSGSSSRPQVSVFKFRRPT